MRYIIFCSLFLLSGCITPNIKHEFPKPPPTITERCPDLFNIVDTEEQLSEFLKVVTKNYSIYHDCAAKHDLLVKWIEEQKIVHDAVFNKN